METDGLIYAYLLDGKGGGRRLGWSEITEWTPEQGLLWVHLDYTAPPAKDWLRNASALDPTAVETLLAEETRPRAAVVGDGLLVCLRGVNMNPGADPEDMVSIRVFCSGSRIVSTRHRRLMSVIDLVESLDAGRGPRGPGDFLVAITGRLVDRMSAVIQELEDRVDQAEDQILAGPAHDQRRALLQVRREAILLRRYLGPQRDALARLQTEPTEWLSPGHRVRLRETGDRVTRYVEDLDAVRDRGGVASEELMSRLSEQLNSRMYLLSLVAAVFLPLGFLTGLLGINVGGIPGADNPWGFWEAVGILTTVAVVQILVFRRKRWL
jgi:zinc transporter